MGPNEVLIWRREHNMKQSDMARYLGVNVKTIVRWERGQTRTPVALRSTLLNYVAPIAGQAPPAFIDSNNPDHETLWPGLYMKMDGRWYINRTHPHTLLKDNPKYAGVDRFPPSILESDDYKEALRLYEATGWFPGCGGMVKPTHYLPMRKPV